MAPEILESPIIDQLDLEQRNALQVELMRQMLGENPSLKEELDWVNKYGEKVSDLIDYYEHNEIRNLALEENYVKAAALLRELL